MALTAQEEALIRQLLDEQAAILSLASSESTIISKLGATKKTLSDLSSATVINDADLLLLRQGTSDKSVSGLIVKSLASQQDASTTVKGIVELATDAETQTGTDAVLAITPASARSNTATAASDPTFANNSTKWASTNWIYGAMGAIATAAGFSYSLTINGYIKFPSWFASLIIQWGQAFTADGTSAIVSYPITFPNEIFTILGADVAVSSATVQVHGFENLNTSQFKTWNSASAGTAVYWIAVGN